jgi:cytosine/uracil/thiamine/allantoin permease
MMHDLENLHFSGMNIFWGVAAGVWLITAKKGERTAAWRELARLVFFASFLVWMFNAFPGSGH